MLKMENSERQARGGHVERRPILRPRKRPSGPVNLTAREHECLLLCAKGNTTIEVSEILDISARTVKFHISNAASKLGTRRRAHAIARAIEMGLLEVAGI